MALGWALLLAAAALSPRFVPFDMDEFVAYQPLGCLSHPLSRTYNVYRETCGENDLRPPLLGRFLPLRSYLYIGSLPVVPFYPFWRLLGTPTAARLQGAVFLLLFVHTACGLVGVRFGIALGSALVFPVFAAAFLVDTGPVGLCLVLLLSGLRLLQLGHDAGPGWRAALLGAAAGGALFLGLWVKLVFAWCLPALLLAALLRPPGAPSRGAKAWGVPALFALAAFSLPSAALLLSETRGGTRYYQVVQRGGLSLDPEEIQGVARGLLVYTADASAFLPRVLRLPPSLLDRAPMIAAALVLAGTPRGRRRQVTALLGAAALTLAVTDLSTRAYEAHHAVFAMAFLVLAVAAALEPRSRRAGVLASLGALVVWVSLAVRLPGAEVDPRSNFAKDALLAWIRETGRDRSTVQLHTSWGTYYLAHLFGDPQEVVLFSKKFPEDPALLVEARGVARQLGRSVLLLTRKPERLEAEVLGPVLGPATNSHAFDNWWAIEYRPEEGTRPPPSPL